LIEILQEEFVDDVSVGLFEVALGLLGPIKWVFGLRQFDTALKRCHSRVLDCRGGELRRALYFKVPPSYVG